MYIMRALLLCILIYTVYRAHAFRAYDCYALGANYTTISLKKVMTCPKLPETDIKVNEVQIQLVQEKDWTFLHVYHCNIVITKLITYCGMHSHSSAVDHGFDSHIWEISKGECIELTKTGTLMLDGRKFSKLQANTTQDISTTLVGQLDQYGNCRGASYTTPNRDYRDVVIQAIIKIELKDYNALFELSSGSLHFNGGTVCPIDKMQCIHPVYGQTFWINSDMEECTSSSRDVIFEGPATISYIKEQFEIGTLLSVNHGTNLFSLNIKGTGHVCHQRAYVTNHNGVFVVVQEKFGFFFKRERIMAQNIDLTMYMNSKIAYSTSLTESLVKQVYSDLTKRDCEIERMTILNKLAIIKQHPMAFGHIMTGEEGYYSVVNGEVAHMLKCVPVDVTARETTICTTNLPVKYGNRSMYMEPVARLLTNVSMEVPCSTLTPSMYEISDNWYTFTPSPALTKDPIILSPSLHYNDIQYINMDDIMTSGLYSEDTMDEFKKFMSFPLVKMDASSYLSAKVSSMPIYDSDVYSSGLLLSQESIQNAVSHHMSNMFKFLSVFGSYAGAIWGIFMIYKIVVTLLSIVINALNLYNAFGFGLHLFASILDALTHAVFRKKEQNQISRDPSCPSRNNSIIELKDVSSTSTSMKRWNEIAKEEGWNPKP